MLSFGIIGEGITDQRIIEQIPLGYFEDDSDEPVVNYIQPPLDATALGGQPAPGGWTLVFESLRQGRHVKALETNDYVIIQLDTDVSEQPGYDVPWKDKDGNDSIDGLIDRVVEKLVARIGTELYARHKERFLFAITVHEIECWLLPLLFDNNKAEKITGCLDTIDRELKRRNEPPLSTAKGKDPRRYQQVARAYARRRKLMTAPERNPSFRRFIAQLATVGAAPAPDSTAAEP